MKYLTIFAATLLALSLALGCSQVNQNDDDNALTMLFLALTGSSKADGSSPNFDNSAQGVYKGVIVGSTGSWKLDYDSGGTGAAPTFEYNYTPTSASECTDRITGTASQSGGAHTLNFSSSTVAPCPTVSFVVAIVLSGTGEITSATLTVNGVSLSISGYKEKTTARARAFEGTYSGNLEPALGGTATSGVWNFTTSGEASVKARIKQLIPACTVGVCEADLLADLNPSTKILSSSGDSFECVSTGCTCRISGTSNEGLTLSTNSVTGNWSITLAANCPAIGQNAGFTVASGTFSGTKKQ